MSARQQSGIESGKPSSLLTALIIVVSVAATAVLWTHSNLPREGVFMAGIFMLAALLWVTEAIPLFATSLLVVGLQAVLLANPGGWTALGFEDGREGPSYRQVFAAAADPILVLFLGGFLLAGAAVKENVDRAMSALLLRPFGGVPSTTLLGLMLVTALFSMWMSNTATTAMMVTLVTPMLARLPLREPFRKALVLAVPIAANLGGMGTPIASPPNAVAIGFLQKSGLKVGFLDWMLVAVPLMVVLLLLSWGLLWRFFRPAAAGLRIEIAGEQLSHRSWFVVGVFVVTVLLWMTDQWHGLPSSVVALLPAILLTATGLLDREDVKQVEWNVLILIAGGISLGAGLQMTGLDREVARWLPTGDGTRAFLLPALVLATIGMSTFMSNTAAANLLLPIGISAAAVGENSVPAIQIALSIAFSASLSMSLPVSTPPNAIAYALGEFSTRDMIRVGALIGVAGAVLVLVAGGFVLRFFGVIQ